MSAGKQGHSLASKMAEQAAPVDTAGLAGGFQQAHCDFRGWHYQQHSFGLVDQGLAYLDTQGIKREVVGYAGIGLIMLLLCTGFAPLVANLICIVYPILGTLSVLRSGQSNSEMPRFLTYWVIFGCFSLFDYYFGESTLYWAVKIAVAVFLYLPQTQGAIFIYRNAVEPLVEKCLTPKTA